MIYLIYRNNLLISFYLWIIQPDTGPIGEHLKGTAVMSKTISFAILHFSVAFTVGYLMTGSVMVGGAIALVEPAVNTVAYHFHERLWRRLGESRPAVAA